jgi:hypothetical protein
VSDIEPAPNAIEDGSGSIDLVDPSTLARDDPIQQERWSVTLDAIPASSAAALYRGLVGRSIACHVQVVSPRFTLEGRLYRSGLYEVCVRREDLARSVSLAKELFFEPAADTRGYFPEGSIWGPSKLGEEPVVLCPVPWVDAWDLAAQLLRAGVPAIVLPDDVAGATPPATETVGGYIADEVMDEITKVGMGRAFGERPAPDVDVTDLPYCVVVERPRLDEAVTMARQVLGERFTLDGSPYDA